MICGGASLSRCSSTSFIKLARSVSCLSRIARIVWYSTSQMQHMVTAMIDAVRLGCTPSITSSPKTEPCVRAPKLLKVLVGWKSMLSSCSVTTLAVPTQRMNIEFPSSPCSMIRSPGMNTRMEPNVMISSRNSMEASAKIDLSRRIFATRSSFRRFFTGGDGCSSSPCCANSCMRMRRSFGNSSIVFAIATWCTMLIVEGARAVTRVSPSRKS
mmetsp:Transcript_67850/g.189427  ORF Transcript_67850/g.189427 Transcript_67850/m.189427 type:complete len:213 (-) Transcript_67850:1086-1724(-)